MNEPGRLARWEVDTLVAAAVRFQPIRNLCLDAIQVQHFDRDQEADLRVLWRAFLDYIEENNGQAPVDVPRLSLAGKVSNVLQNGAIGPGVTFESLLGNDGLIAWIYQWPLDAFEEVDLRRKLERFLAERNNELIREQILLNSERGVSEERQTKIKRLMETSAVLALPDERIFQSPLPTVSDLEAFRFTYVSQPTSIVWLDKRLDGGCIPQQVYTVIGPTGVGKTTLAVMLCVTGGRTQRDNLRKSDNIGVPGRWYLITTEMSRQAMLIRVLAYTARVHKKRIVEAFRDGMDKLAGPGDKRPSYEYDMIRDYGLDKNTFKSERERVAMALAEVDIGMNIIDLSGAEPALLGTDIRGLARMIKRKCDSGIPCGGVVIDWAGNMVTNYYLKKFGKMPEPGQYTMELNNFVGSVFSELAAPCKCPVWVFHQLAGASIKAGTPLTRRGAADAAYSTGFSNNAWYGFAFGNKDESSSTCQFWASKTRDSESDPNGVVLKIEGHLCDLRDATGKYVADQDRRRIVPVELRETVVDPDDVDGATDNTPPEPSPMPVETSSAVSRIKSNKYGTPQNEARNETRGDDAK